MMIRQILVCAVAGLGIALGCPSCGLAQLPQQHVLSASPPNVEYQYQMYYPRYWGWPGPGLSLGGSLPSKGREGISSFYGRPLPPPLGAGVYVNPFAYSTQLPGPPLAFGLASSSPSPTSSPQQMGQPISQVAAATNQPIPVGPSFYAAATQVVANRQEISRQEISGSRLASLERSRQIESYGDESLRRQQWTQAYINYRNAVMTAGDRADPHVRLGLACLMLRRFPEAAVEFRQALTIDPTTGNLVAMMQSLLGSENPPVQAEIIQSVAKWTKENLRDQDHLFLLGLVLLFNKDPRSNDVLEAALHVTGPKAHLLALLTPSTETIVSNQLNQDASPAPIPDPPEPARLPELHQNPLALNQTAQ